jgi:cyclic dehypoxanthinyl futalosine synthase
MMYGTVETPDERLEHMLRLRDLQDETGGFTAFITWSYQPEHTERGGAEATGVEYLRTLAPRGSCSTTSTTCRRRG